MLLFAYRVIIYGCINTPGHGNRKTYGINGYYKTYLKQKLCMIGTEEYNNGSMRMNSASMICDNNK